MSTLVRRIDHIHFCLICISLSPRVQEAEEGRQQARRGKTSLLFNVNTRLLRRTAVMQTRLREQREKEAEGIGDAAQVAGSRDQRMHGSGGGGRHRKTDAALAARAAVPSSERAAQEKQSCVMRRRDMNLHMNHLQQQQ